MSGALLNLLPEGVGDDHHVVGVERALFKGAYRRPMNFGMQKFRVDPVKPTQLQYSRESEYHFRIDKNNSDLLMDSHLVLTLPNIWSPIHADTINKQWRPFEFKWNRRLGATIVKKVEILIGNRIVQTFDGHYIQNLVDREFSDAKRRQFNEMVGHVPELYNPSAANGGHYPSVSHKDVDRTATESLEIEPSIRSRTLVVPIMGWYAFSSKQAVPLCCLKNTPTDMEIRVTIRPVDEWYTTKNVDSHTADLAHPEDHALRKHVSPDSMRGDEKYQIHRFTKQPPGDAWWETAHATAGRTYPDYTMDDTLIYYKDSDNNNINAVNDIHLITTNVVLTADEVQAFLSKRNEYLYRDVHRIEYNNVKMAGRERIENAGLAANITLFMQRNDVKLRNEFDNYTNHSYLGEREAPLLDPSKLSDRNQFGHDGTHQWNIGALSQLRTTGPYKPEQEARIMNSFTLMLAAKERERDFYAYVVSDVERFTKCSGGGSSSQDHVHHYSFELNSDPFELSPSGVLNASYYSRIEVDYRLFPAPLNPLSKFETTCDFENQIIVTKEDNIYKYEYNMYIYIERYNKMIFENGEFNLAIKY